jgi:hypothetical protein
MHASKLNATARPDGSADEHGNVYAREGVDRCHCGVKYWENDRCVDCGTEVEVYTCSFCDKRAAYVGNGQDGDFYCEGHKGRATFRGVTPC